MTPGELRGRIKQGRVRVNVSNNGEKIVLYYLADGEFKKIEAGEFDIVRSAPDGSMVFAETDGEESGDVLAVPSTQWRIPSHDSTQYGTRLLSDFIPGRKFPFPKSLYAVEDALRFFVKSKPHAVILDFFAGSGTTAHAVMRLNKQDGGRRTSLSITNNEVSEVESRRLRAEGQTPGNPAWEAQGIFERITKPRVDAAITGLTPEGEPIRGAYRFLDEFPMGLTAARSVARRSRRTPGGPQSRRRRCRPVPDSTISGTTSPPC